MDKKWIRILEADKEDTILPYVKQKFDEHGITYKMELEEVWEGSGRIPAYIAKFVVYVESECECKDGILYKVWNYR